MEIRNNSYNTYIKPIPKSKVSPAFKGYFACPIKELHFQAVTSLDRRYHVIKELSSKCKQYFKIFVQGKDAVVDVSEISRIRAQKYESDNDYINSIHDYGQDNKLFTERRILLLKGCDGRGYEEATKLAKNLHIKTDTIVPHIQGGNCFLGKKTDGENFALIGAEALCVKNDSRYYRSVIRRASVKEIAESLKIKPENVYVIRQPDYHLDMAIRPLKYPYVLVDDMDLTIQLMKNDKQRAYVNNTYYTQDQKVRIKEQYYSTPSETCENLKEHGFVPIRVPGSLGFYRSNLNYLNAIVHQNPDGSLVYITNHSKAGHSFWKGVNMEKLFSDYLKSQCPDVKDVIFIDGKGEMGKCLNRESAGIHCLVSERPDFEQWNKLLSR